MTDGTSANYLQQLLCKTLMFRTMYIIYKEVAIIFKMLLHFVNKVIITITKLIDQC